MKNMSVQSGLCQDATKPRQTKYSRQGREIFGFNNKLNQALQSVPQNTSQRIDQAIKSASAKYRVPENMIRAVMKQESAFNPKATSHCGAQGLMQLMPGTAKEMGVKNAYNIEENIEGGTKYLSRMLKTFGGNKKLALAAYNAGPGAVMKYNGIPPYRETQNYVQRITASMERGTVRIPENLPDAPGAPTQVPAIPQADTLVANYTPVNEISGPSQIQASDILMSSTIRNDMTSKVNESRERADEAPAKEIPSHALFV